MVLLRKVRFALPAGVEAKLKRQPLWWTAWKVIRGGTVFGVASFPVKVRLMY